MQDGGPWDVVPLMNSEYSAFEMLFLNVSLKVNSLDLIRLKKKISP